ncbi:MAG: MFS transporter [Sulfitobacter sp.]
MRLHRTIALLPWFQLFNGLLFWQAVWFLYFQAELSGAQAIILYSVYDIATMVLEVPSGYFSDKIGRRFTLLLSTLSYLIGCLALAGGDSFYVFAVGQCLIGAGAALKSGTDSSLLFEALEATGRSDEIEHQEVRAWRFSLTGFALSAIAGGAMSLWSPQLPFYATALSFACAALMVLRMAEPPRNAAQSDQLPAQIAALKSAFVNPVLVWLFGLSVLMYGFSHLPFVFGQPFILGALESLGMASDAPLVSGAVTSCMMLVSALASQVALSMRRLMGLPLLLLSAFGLQIAIIAALASSASAILIAVLLLRHVPNSLAHPFILARIHPLLETNTRATYLSLRSLGGKLLFAISLLLAAMNTQDAGLLPVADLQNILGWYTSAGLLCLAVMTLLARSIALSPAQDTADPTP